MKPPIIYTRGCQIFVDKWLRGDDEESTRRSCPFCRREHAYAETSIIKGLDDYRIALIFRGSLISRISRIWNRSHLATVL